MYLRLLLIFLCFISSSVQAQSLLHDKEMQKTIFKGLDKMYNFEFDQADVYFNQVKVKYPLNPAYNLLKSMSLNWEMLCENSYKTRASENLNYLNKALTLADKMLEQDSDDPEGIFFTLSGRSALAVYYSQTGQTLKAVNEARKAYTYMKGANEQKTKLYDFYFPVGLYNYYVVQYPENHPVFKPFMMFFMNGNKSEGLKQMDFATKNGVYSKVESAFYLGHIYLRYEENYEQAIKYSGPLVEKYPRNIYFKINHCEGLIGAKKYSEAMVEAHDLYKSEALIAKIAASAYFGLLNERYFKRLEDAKTFYVQTLNLAAKAQVPVQDFTGQCYAGLGRYYNKKGDTKQAVENYKKCLEVTEYLSLRKEAETYLDEYD